MIHLSRFASSPKGDATSGLAKPVPRWHWFGGTPVSGDCALIDTRSFALIHKDQFTLSPKNPFTLSPKNPFTLSPKNPFSLSHNNPLTLSHNNPLTLSHNNPFTLSLSKRGAGPRTAQPQERALTELDLALKAAHRATQP
ncbi:hypothetical protein [Acidovorax sp.]|uniref:hypothetical protein n=1 Tax=Acidovorax sp. TaxID=1872122 RepID=UPI00391EE270